MLTRRFSVRPPAVVLGATGSASPLPEVCRWTPAVIAMFNYLSGKRQGARDYKEARAQYDEDLSNVQARLAAVLLTERSDRRQATPDPAEVLLNAVGPGHRLWERRRSDPDYLTWQLGLADRPSLVSITDRNVKDFDQGRADSGQRRSGRHVTERERPRRTWRQGRWRTPRGTWCPGSARTTPCNSAS